MPNKLPKRVNIIWVGTQQPMSTEKLDVIKLWSEKLKNHIDFKVVLWVDVKSSKKENLEEIKNCYVQKGLNSANVVFKDISELDTLSEESSIAYSCARHELDRMEANFGNASDILRYIILTNFGGGYFDIDIEPHDIESFVKIFKDYEQPVLYVGTDSQTPYISDNIKIYNHLIAGMFKCFLKMLNEPDFLETWRSQFDEKIWLMIRGTINEGRLSINDFKVTEAAEKIRNLIEINKADYIRNPMDFYRFLAEKCSNDMFIATVANPIMQEILKRVINNYTTQLLSVNNKNPGRLLSPENQRKVAVKFCYSGWNKMLRAIPITGPDAVREAVFNHAKNGTSEIRTIRGSEGDFVNTYPAALTWLRSFTKNCQSPSELIQSCIDDLVFEATHLGILRLDDYIYLINVALQNQGIVDTSEFVKLFVTELESKVSTHKMSGFVLQNTSTDFGTFLDTSATQAIEVFKAKYGITKAADIDVIINCLFMEDDFTQGSIQADYVPNGNDNKINALNSLIHQFEVAATFVNLSPYFDISDPKNLFTASKKDPFGKVYEIMLRINRAIDFLNNIETINTMLGSECFSKQKIQIQLIHEFISTCLSKYLEILYTGFNQILTKMMDGANTISAETFSSAKRIQKEICDEISGMRLAYRLNVQLQQTVFEEFETRYNSASKDSRKRLGL